MVSTFDIRDPFIEYLNERAKGHVPRPVVDASTLRGLGAGPVPQQSACKSSLCQRCCIESELLRGKWQPATRSYSCVNIYCEPSHDWSLTRPGFCDCCGLEVLPSSPNGTSASDCDMVSFGGLVVERMEAWAKAGVPNSWWEMDDGSIDADFAIPNYGLQNWLYKQELMSELRIDVRKVEIWTDAKDAIRILANEMFDDIAKTLLRTQQDFVRWVMSLGWAPFSITLQSDRDIYRREQILIVVMTPETTGVIKPLSMSDFKSCVDSMPSRFK